MRPPCPLRQQGGQSCWSIADLRRLYNPEWRRHTRGVNACGVRIRDGSGHEREHRMRRVRVVHTRFRPVCDLYCLRKALPWW
jgi:hypothetical protein